MNKEDLQKVIDKLNAAIPGGVECPMCHSRNFQVINGSFANILQSKLQELVLDGQSVPSVMIICPTCGFMSQHSIGVLCHEVLENKDTSDEK